ncbi:hypothetical protein OPIT5_04245 [Opitutaceae bacterium TAV5]|nr:hypothetical protein OPIT5_04245 [Opitutaceae bacterium TAV5]
MFVILAPSLIQMTGILEFSLEKQVREQHGDRMAADSQGDSILGFNTGNSVETAQHVNFSCVRLDAEDQSTMSNFPTLAQMKRATEFLVKCDQGIPGCDQVHVGTGKRTMRAELVSDAINIGQRPDIYSVAADKDDRTGRLMGDCLKDCLEILNRSAFGAGHDEEQGGRRYRFWANRRTSFQRSITWTGE